jgi:hypothetical protein
LVRRCSLNRLFIYERIKISSKSLLQVQQYLAIIEVSAVEFCFLFVLCVKKIVPSAELENNKKSCSNLRNLVV